MPIPCGLPSPGDLFRAAQYIAYYYTLHLPIANAAADLAAAAAAAAAAKRATTNPARSLQSIKLSALPPHGAADICGKSGVSGTVYRIMYQGITCAFKKFHPQMVETVRREIQSLQVKIIYFSILSAFLTLVFFLVAASSEHCTHTGSSD